ncbi:MAG TPA: hypothetical protein EYQ12_03255 [Oceanospirillaceae bacterium]|nr:hypothetical protein [Oceanospirillaceae bacterium]
MKIKDDLLAELAVQLGDRRGVVSPGVEQLSDELADELEAIQAMLVAGELSAEQARLHRQLRLNSFNMSLLALEGVGDIALEQTLVGLVKVVRRFYGV